MADVAILNPAREAAICQKMVMAAKAKLELLEGQLTRTPLERDNYLMKIGAASELRSLVVELEREYARNFKT